MISRLTLRNWLAVTLVVMSALPLSAGDKKRGIQKPPAGGTIVSPPPAPAPVDTMLVGTVVDATTNLPVINADVFAQAANRYYFRTNAQGSFTAKLPAGTYTFTISRFGYASSSVQVTLSSGSNLTERFPMTSFPTAQIRTTNGTVFQVAADTVEFGYLVPLSGFIKEKSLSACRTDGSRFAPDRTEIKRVLGPAVPSTVTACCDRGPVQGVNVELRTGDRVQAYLSDSCFGYAIAVIGLDQTKAQLVEVKLTDVAEVIFP